MWLMDQLTTKLGCRVNIFLIIFMTWHRASQRDQIYYELELNFFIHIFFHGISRRLLCNHLPLEIQALGSAQYAYVMAIRVVEFSNRGTKLEKKLSKNQHTQRKLLNFENWVIGEHSIANSSQFPTSMYLLWHF